jgi:hypothetical protein
MKRTLFLALALSIAGAAFAQPPIGYERWLAPGPIGSGSGVDFGLKPKDIYKEYAAQFFIGLPSNSPLQQQKDKRLIDIEWRSTGIGVADYIWDIVWVTNEGDFKHDSWFIHELKADEVLLLAELDDVVILDIERYPKGSEFRFAVILQRNIGKFDWSVLLGVEPSVAAEALHGGLRAVDVDRRQVCSRRDGRDQACPTVLDVVMVENTGSNFVDALDLFEAFPPVDVPGFQLRDLEPLGAATPMTGWISPGSPYQTGLKFTKEEVAHSHLHTGRIIDLEIVEEFIDPSHPGFGTTVTWWTVNLIQQ